MTTQIQILATVAALLVGLERAASSDITFVGNIQGKARAAWLLGITLVIAILNNVVGGDTWQASVLHAVETSGTAFLLAVLSWASEAKVKAAAVAKVAAKATIVALFLGSAALAQTGCVGTLEETRAQITVTSVAGVKTADAPRPPVCLKLSQQRTAALVGARVGEVGMASTAAVGIVVDSVEPKSDHGKQVQHDWTLGLAIASGVFAVGGAAGEVAGKLLTDEWIAQGCGQ